jgi:hypothetical protein
LNRRVKDKIDPARDQVLHCRGKTAIWDKGEPGPAFFLQG